MEHSSGQAHCSSDPVLTAGAVAASIGGAEDALQVVCGDWPWVDAEDAADAMRLLGERPQLF
jgi:hypothetical protein